MFSQAVAQQTGLEVQPTPGTLRVIQDKFRQKQHFEAAGVPLPEYREIKCAKCATSAGAAFGYPYMLKSKTCVRVGLAAARAVCASEQQGGLGWQLCGVGSGSGVQGWARASTCEPAVAG